VFLFNIYKFNGIVTILQNVIKNIFGLTSMKYGLVVIALLGMVLLSCTQKEEISIGAILPLTGNVAYVGEDARNGMNLALEEIGNLFTIIYEDSAGENQQAIAAFQKITQANNANIIVTSTSWISNALYTEAKETETLQLVIASAVFHREQNDKAIRFTVDVLNEAIFIAEYLQQFERVGLLYMNNDFGQGWAEQLGNKLTNLIVSEAYELTELDVSTQLSKIKAANVDALMLASGGRETALFARKAREIGITAQLVSARPAESKELQDEPATEGIIYSYPAYDIEHPFVENYVTKYGKQPTIFSAEAYDLIITLNEAIKECKENTKCIHDWYKNNSYKGALGTVTFDSLGDASYSFTLKEVSNGKFELYEEKNAK